MVNYLHDEDGANHTREQVTAADRRAIVVRADITREDEVERLFDQAVEAFGTVHILMNNAGVDASGTEVADLTTDVFDERIKTYVYGPFWTCRRFINERKKDGSNGKIINVTAVHDEIPRAGAADYDCGKGGLRNLTRTLALELAPLHINVNNLSPGMVLAPFNQPAIDDSKVREDQVQSIPWKRAAEPEEVARLAVFLASDDADYVTGSSYVMDGGLMQNPHPAAPGQPVLVERHLDSAVGAHRRAHSGAAAQRPGAVGS